MGTRRGMNEGRRYRHGWTLFAVLATTGCSADERSSAPNYQCSAAGCACVEDFADCDGTLDNGCEVDLRSDPEHCAGCAHSCGGGACSQGACQAFTLFPLDGEARHLAVGETHLYWTEWSDQDGLWAAPRQGGEPVVFADQPYPACVVVRDGHVYWRADDALWRAPEQGGEPERIATHSTLGEAPLESRCLAVTSTHAYWIGLFAGTNRDELWRHSFAQAETELVATASDDFQFGLIAHEEGVFWADEGYIYQSLDGGAASVLLHEGMCIGDVAVDDMYVYWVDFCEDAVWAEARAGGVRLVLGEAQPFPFSIVAKEQVAIWANWNDGTIRARSLAGVEIEELAAQQIEANALAVDETGLYWLTPDAVMKRAW